MRVPSIVARCCLSFRSRRRNRQPFATDHHRVASPLPPLLPPPSSAETPLGKDVPRDGGCEQGVHARCIGAYFLYWPLGLILALAHVVMALLCLVLVDSWQLGARTLFGRLPLGLDIFFAREHLALALAAMAPFSSRNFEDERGGIYQRRAAAAPMAEPFIRVSEMSLGGGFNFA